MKSHLLLKAAVATAAVVGSLIAAASTASAAPTPTTGHIAATSVGNALPTAAGMKHIEWNRPTSLSTLRAKMAALHASPMDSVTCYGDSAYPVVYGNTDTWSDLRYASSGIDAKVQYWFCQRYSGDPVGINFSYGWVEAYRGNWTIEFGQYWSKVNDGASIHHNNCVCWSAPDYEGDGIGPAPLDVTVNSSQWVSDFSNAGPGNWVWSAQFWVYFKNQATGATGTLAAVSPTF